MSLLDNGPHTVTVYPDAVGDDWRGNVIERPSSSGVTVSGCSMQPLNATVDTTEGQQVRIEYRLIGSSLPLGPWSRVVWVDGQGITRKFSVVGQPATRRWTRATSHTTATLREER